MHLPAALAAAPALARFDAEHPQRLQRALDDLRMGQARWRLALGLAWLDLRNRYRGSVLGPFWLTLSTAVMLLTLGFLYAALFNMSVREYLPWLGASLIIWTVISQIIQDACASLTSAEGIIRQMPLPYTVHALRCVIRNGLVAAHNLPLVLITFLACGVIPGWEALLALPGLALLAINGLAASLFLGMVCARFRDIAPIVASVMQIAFFISPVIWKPELLTNIDHQLLLLNPFYAMMETVRGPLLGEVTLMPWVATLLFTVLNCAGTFAFFMRFRARIAFWV
jgi:lipopolysaccharide transport system permease protein